MIKNRNKLIKAVKDNYKRIVVIATGVIMTMAFTVGMSGSYMLGYDAYMGDTFVATVSSFKDGTELIKNVERDYGIEIDTELNYYLRLVQKDECTKTEQAQENLKSTDARFVNGCNIVVDDMVLCSTKTRTEAAEAVLFFASQYNKDGAAISYDKELLQVPAFVLPEKTVTSTAAKQLLDKNITATEVVTTTVTEQIPFSTQNIDDPTVDAGISYVTQEGINGTKEVTYQKTFVDGKEAICEVMSENITQAPTDKVVYNGTKRTGVGTGTFTAPTIGDFSSAFGTRWNRQHKGVDITNSVGTPIYAADSGKVVYSGWMSGYGYLIQIDHANGYVTYYAHCSSLSKNVGDIVAKGEYIAAMGSTGNSTGSHLHFEVRKDGVPQNPSDYVKY